MKTVNVEEYTYNRLTSVLKEIMHEKRRDINYDDVINELIDTYQQNNWAHFGAAAGGG
jgi:DNA-directed RNA polymerase delta subunit